MADNKVQIIYGSDYPKELGDMTCYIAMDRRIARYKMKLEGIQRMNRPHGGSYFSRRWRDYI